METPCQSALQRYVPLLVWVITLGVVILTPLKIVSYGYLPKDDALRDAGKAISNQPWSEILVMRENFKQDPNPGWHFFLRQAHLQLKADADTLVAISVIVLGLLFSLAALPWLRRPEVWLAVLLAASTFLPKTILRMTYGRPLLFTTAVLICLLFYWGKESDERPRPVKILLTTLLFAAACWVHGIWYLYALLVAAVGLASWRSGLWLAACWLSGSFLGALLTGHPFQHLGQALSSMFGIFGSFTLQRMLVTELAPSDGESGALILLVATLFWLVITGSWERRFWRHPALLLAIIAWLLGLKVQRFWLDWGAPALLVWLALALQTQLEKYQAPEALKRLWLCLALAAGVFWGTTSDRENRWTRNLTLEYLTPENTTLAGWLPEKGGIVYSADMGVFFQTFFKNPNAPWRYVLGFESAWMKPDDLKVLRHIQWNLGDPRAYEPWVKKMRPQDRLIVRASSLGTSARPEIAGLEWHYGVTDLWIGRLPRKP